MIGKKNIKISNQKVSFNFYITRNITIIRGNSATGKTTLINMISDYEILGKQSGVKITSDKPCRVLTGNDWQVRLDNIMDSIVFIDEGNKFIKSDEFARSIRSSNNYYVIITRESLHNLPYSVDEIYEMYSYRHSVKIGKVYNGLNKFYSNISMENYSITNTDLIITEDSNSGYEFFLNIAQKNGLKCISACGKSNIFNMLTTVKERVIIIADGAAFGSEMERLYSIQSTYPEKITLYLPESFEWLILQSDVVRIKGIKEILDSPENHIESSIYFSWERFFTEFLSSNTKGTYMQYLKEKLSHFYLQEENIKKILNTINKK